MLQDNRDIGNAEGYCNKCGNSLGITGQCYICSINEYDFKNMMEGVTLNEPQAHQAEQPASRNRWIIDAARRLSQAASHLKAIEGMHLEADELSDAWDHAYAELYRANQELIELLPVEPKAELR